MAAWRELLERIENESKAYGSDFGSQNLPTWQECETAVHSLYSQYELISFSLWHYCASTPTWQECATAVSSLCSLIIGASILFIAYAMIALPLRRHWDCGAHDSFQGGIPMLSIASQCIHVTIPLTLDLFHPVTLFSSERRPAALVLSILKGAPRFCA